MWSGVLLSSLCMIFSCFWVRVWKALCYWYSHHSTLLKTHRLCTKIIRVWPFQRRNTSLLWEYFDLYKQFPSIQEAIFRVQCTCLLATFCHRNDTIHTSSNLPLAAKEDMMANTKCTTPLWYQLIQVCSVNPILPSAVSTKINITHALWIIQKQRKNTILILVWHRPEFGRTTTPCGEKNSILPKTATCNLEAMNRQKKGKWH